MVSILIELLLLLVLSMNEKVCDVIENEQVAILIPHLQLELLDVVPLLLHVTLFT